MNFSYGTLMEVEEGMKQAHNGAEMIRDLFTTVLLVVSCVVMFVHL